MSDAAIASEDPDEETTSLSKQLYYAMVMLTSDDGCWEYEPNVRARRGAILHSLLRKEFWKGPVEIETFEHDVRKWEEQGGKSLDSDVKVSALMGGMQKPKVRTTSS